MVTNNKRFVDDKYRELNRILMDAMEQATGGKGKERHADGENFEDQKICVINRWLRGSPVAGPLFQAVKKAVESSRMTPGAAIRELYGSINYTAAAIRLLEEELDRAVITSAVNAEIRMIEHTKPNAIMVLPGGEPVYDVPSDEPAEPAEPDELAVFEQPGCDECFYMKLLPSQWPCKPCLEDPSKPHFTESTKPLCTMTWPSSSEVVESFQD